MARNLYNNRYKDHYKSQERRKIYLRVLFYSGVVAILLCLGIYAFFFANLFDVREIRVQGSDIIDHAQISTKVDEFLDQRRFFIRRRDNSLLVSTDLISQTLASSFPRIRTISVKRVTRHALEVTFQERTASGIWCNYENQCYYFDENGVAYLHAEPSSGYIFTVIEDKRDKRLSLGNTILESQWLSLFPKIKDLLVQNDIHMTRFIIPSNSWDEFDIQTPEGPKILMNATTDTTAQIQALAKLLQKKITPDAFRGLEYIDLRIQDRIYYK
jgi:cell division septal protein FtsQ